MLRFLVLLLVLVNGLYFAWSHEFLRGYGFGPVPTGEPQRLSRQIRPEAIRILSSQEVAQEAVVAQTRPKLLECLQTGLFDDHQAEVLRQALQAALPSKAWVLDPAMEPARWIVYMGKYTNPESLAKKRKELTALKVSMAPLTNPKLEPGLSLGGFESQAMAEAALASFNQRGVHTARVVLEHAQATGLRLRFPAVDEALRARLNTLSTELGDRPLQACP
jgi:hypothetical protein